MLAPLTFLLVAGAGCPSLFESTSHREVKVRQAQIGKDGSPATVTTATVVNGYALLAEDAPAGQTFVRFSNTTPADARFTVLEKGDLVLIIQMQGATINTTDTADTQFPATSAYGTVTALGGAGRYELAGVEGVTGSQITLACRLKNSYTAAGNTQVIRVPQYTTLTIGNGGSITAPAWNGSWGGVVAVHAESTVTLNGTGKIDVSGLGFRGGVIDTSSAPQGDPKNVIFRSTDPLDGAEKGESIAGYQSTYPNGRYGRGAPANGGGGGNSHNSAGGGGANAGGASWTGQGVMASCSATSPWRLDDGYTGNPATAKCATSPGGGRGGYSLSFASNQDPTAVAPGNTSWRGNRREQVGGLGGHPVSNAVGGADARLFMGGGGGAGDGDNSRAGPGGAGGGLVLLIAGGGVAGAGSILANGANGGDATVTGNNFNDAAGGGGGGGTIVISAPTISAIAITARGGRGGNHAGGTTNAGQNTEEAEGPGGGGGGGYVAASDRTLASISATGGDAGTTDRAVMTDFPQNGATAGNAGVTDGSATGLLYCGFQLTTIVTHPDAITNSTTGVFTFTNPVAGVTFECRVYTTTPSTWAACNGVDGGTGNGYTASALADGTYTFEVRATDTGGSVEDPPASFTWTVDTVPPNTTIATMPPATSGDPTADFTFESTETPPAFECKLDAATTWTACNATYSTTALADGTHTLSVRAKDAAGNVDPTPATYEWNVNTGLPVTTIATHPEAISNDPTGDFTFTNTRDPVTYECKLDTGAWASCGASYTTPAQADGSHTLSVRATASALDGGIFLETPPVTFTWTIDTVPPDTSITSNPPSPSTSPTGTFTFASTETPATYECQIDGGAWSACTATFTTAPLANGTHTLAVRSKDAAGNVDATPATSTWAIAAMQVDGGGALDGGLVDGSIGPALDSGTVALDGGRIDAGGVDGAGRLDGGQLLDGAAVDASRDVAAEAAVADTRPGAEPGPDVATVEPGRDAASPVNNDAPPANADAAITPPATGIKVLGGGFCALAQARTTSPAAFLLLAFAGLALLRRKRR